MNLFKKKETPLEVDILVTNETTGEEKKVTKEDILGYSDELLTEFQENMLLWEQSAVNIQKFEYASRIRNTRFLIEDTLTDRHEKLKDKKKEELRVMGRTALREMMLVAGPEHIKTIEDKKLHQMVSQCAHISSFVSELGPSLNKQFKEVVDMLNNEINRRNEHQ